jgi:hypothetical protein
LAGTTINRVEVHDAKNAKWRARAACNVTVTTATNSGTVVATITPAGCTIASATATPDFACGDG